MEILEKTLREDMIRRAAAHWPEMKPYLKWARLERMKIYQRKQDRWVWITVITVDMKRNGERSVAE